MTTDTPAYDVSAAELRLSEPPVAPFVNGRPVIVPDWSAVLHFGAWGGCWDCPTQPGVI